MAVTSSCLEALRRAGRVAPEWMRVAWSEALGVYAPNPRFEHDTIKGFVERLAELLARLCGVVLHRSLVSQRLLAIRVTPWSVEGGLGDECRGVKRLIVMLDTGFTLDLVIEAVVTPAGDPVSLRVESRALGCGASWGSR